MRATVERLTALSYSIYFAKLQAPCESHQQSRPRAAALPLRSPPRSSPAPALRSRNSESPRAPSPSTLPPPRECAHAPQESIPAASSRAPSHSQSPAETPLDPPSVHRRSCRSVRSDPAPPAPLAAHRLSSPGEGTKCGRTALRRAPRRSSASVPAHSGRPPARAACECPTASAPLPVPYLTSWSRQQGRLSAVRAPSDRAQPSAESRLR